MYRHSGPFDETGGATGGAPLRKSMSHHQHFFFGLHTQTIGSPAMSSHSVLSLPSKVWNLFSFFLYLCFFLSLSVLTGKKC